MNRLAIFDIRLTMIDPGEPRFRRVGSPAPSRRACDALFAAREAAEAVLRECGFETVSVGFGVTASEAD